jgi:hypothetical protein
MLKIIVTVQPSGQQKEFRAVEGGAPCDVVAAVLKEEFGPGSLHPAGINTAPLPLADVRLQAGSYDYKTFAGVPGTSAVTGAQEEAEMKVSLMEVFSLTMVPIRDIFKLLQPANAVMKRGYKGGRYCSQDAMGRNQHDRCQLLSHRHAD